MESNAENDERREERYRRKSEHDRLRRDRETDEKSMQGLQLNVNVILLKFCKGNSYRLARHREYNRTKHVTMSTEQWKYSQKVNF